MKIAIISDTHDNLINIQKAMDFIKKEDVGVIIHCGDVSNLFTLNEILKNFQGEFYLSLGNADDDSLKDKEILKKSKNLKIYENFGEFEMEGKKIAFSHFPQVCQNLSQLQKYDFVFYGHTHKPLEEKIGKTRLINPGNLAGLYYKASFAIYDSREDSLKLKILEMLK
ncbi:MAG: YfcE family phosphodiesterase [Candidatus Aenigmatarchaeota archaeon]